MEDEAAELGQLANALKELAGEAAPGEGDGDDLALDALDTGPCAGVGTEAGVVLGAEVSPRGRRGRA